MTNIVFYDGQCGLCDYVVQWLLEADKKQQFLFAPLQGMTAQRLLSRLPPEAKEADSLIFIENAESSNPQYYLYGKAALRICWHLGGFWALLGWISFLPSVLYDWAYRLVARNRHKIFPEACTLPTQEQKHRFLQ